MPTAPPPPPPGLELPNNPGTIEDLHKKAQNVFPMFFDGAKILVNKGLNSHFQVSHTLTLAKQSPGYRFGATYVGTKMLSQTEVCRFSFFKYYTKFKMQIEIGSIRKMIKKKHVKFHTNEV